MKWLVLLVPLLGVSGFAGYYHHWSAARQAAHNPASIFTPDDPFRWYQQRDGRQDALNDLVRGHPRLLGFGLPAPWTREYRDILARDYGVEYQAVAGCVVSESLVRYAGAYNSTIENFLTSAHGPEVFTRIVDEARARHAARPAR